VFWEKISNYSSRCEFKTFVVFTNGQLLEEYQPSHSALKANMKITASEKGIIQIIVKRELN